MTNPPEFSFQIAVLTDELAALNPPEPHSRVEWLACRQRGDDQFEFLKDGAPLARVDFANPRLSLPNLIALIVVGDTSLCETIRSRWSSSFPASQIDFVAIAALDRNVLQRAAIDSLADHLNRYRKFGGQASLDLAAYRREYDRLQNCFSRLEEYVSLNALDEPRVLFECPAGPAAQSAGAATPLDAGASEAAQRVLQLLPVDSLGVAGVAIRIHSVPREGTILNVTLRAIETEQTFGSWSIQAKDVSRGWLNLALDQAISEPALSLELIVELPEGSGRAALMWGPPHPYPEYRARINGQDNIRGPLALRIFGGPPGVRVPAVSGTFAPTDASLPAAWLVPAEQYADAYQVSPALTSGQASLVIYDSVSKSLTVHPRDGGTTTVARLDLAVPSDVWCLTAQISLAHELANPVSYALMAAPLVGKGADALLIENLDESAISFSGWTDLAALERSRISVFIPANREKTMSVYLLTRQASNASPDFAWARFERFQYRRGPASYGREADSPSGRPAGREDADERSHGTV